MVSAIPTPSPSADARPRDLRDSPLLGWGIDEQSNVPDKLSLHDDAEDQSSTMAGRNSISSDIFDDYYSDHNVQLPANNTPALNALSNILFDAANNPNPPSHSFHDDHSLPGTPTDNIPLSQIYNPKQPVVVDQIDDYHHQHRASILLDDMPSAPSSVSTNLKSSVYLNQSGSPTTYSSSRSAKSSPTNSPFPNSFIPSSPTMSSSLPLHHPAPTQPGHFSSSHPELSNEGSSPLLLFPTGSVQSTNSARGGSSTAGSTYLSMSRSNSNAASGSSTYTSNPPSRASSNVSRAPSQRSVTSTSHSSSHGHPPASYNPPPPPPPPLPSNVGGAPFTGPIPRPHRTSLARHNSSSHATSSGYSRSSHNNQSRRASALRSSIVSADLDLYENEDGQIMSVTSADDTSSNAGSRNTLGSLSQDGAEVGHGSIGRRSTTFGTGSVRGQSYFGGSNGVEEYDEEDGSGYATLGMGMMMPSSSSPQFVPSPSRSPVAMSPPLTSMTPPMPSSSSPNASPQSTSPALRSRPSRTDLRRKVSQTALGKSPNMPSVPLGRSASSGTTGLTRGGSAPELDVSGRGVSSTGSMVGLASLVGQSPASSATSPVGDDPTSFLMMHAEDDVAPEPSHEEPTSQTESIGIAATSDQPVQISGRVSRSRASSISQMGGGPDGATPVPGAYSSTGLASTRTSWGGYPPPPSHGYQALASKKSYDWGAVEERDETEGYSSGQGEDGAGVMTDEDHDAEDTHEDLTYNSGLEQQHVEKAAATSTAPTRADARITNMDEKQRYRFSTGSSILDVSEYETDASFGSLSQPKRDSSLQVGNMVPQGGKQNHPYLAGREDTDMSEASEDDFNEKEEDGICRPEEEERTPAIVTVEEGRGLIVDLSGLSIAGVEIKPGTTHIVMDHTTTPGQVPGFLTNVLPTIWETLLALDISGNFLEALPPALESCTALVELNIGNNPLRVLPFGLSHLRNLQVLIADSTSITSLPAQLALLNNLRTLSVRRNRLYSLPSWICLFSQIEWLLVDGNPFQGPWKQLMEPLMNPVPLSPAYPPNTPFSMFSNASTFESNSTPPASAGVMDPKMSLYETGAMKNGANSDLTVKQYYQGYRQQISSSTATSASSSAANSPLPPIPSPLYPFPPNTDDHGPAPAPSATSSMYMDPSQFGDPNSQYTQGSYFPRMDSELGERSERGERQLMRMKSSPGGYSRPNTVATGSSTISRRTYVEGQERSQNSSNGMRSREPSQYGETRSTGSVLEDDPYRKTLKKMKSADDVRKRTRERAGSVSAALSSGAGLRDNEEVPPLPNPGPGLVTPASMSAHSSPMPGSYADLPPHGGSYRGGPNSTVSTYESSNYSSSADPSYADSMRFVSMSSRSGGHDGSVSSTSLLMYASMNPSPMHQRKALTPSLWDPPVPSNPNHLVESPVENADNSPDSQDGTSQRPPLASGRSHSQSISEKVDKGAKKWGFLKKMSMTKMKSTPGSVGSPPPVRPPTGTVPRRPATAHASTAPPGELPKLRPMGPAGLGISTRGPSIGVTVAPSDPSSSGGGLTPTPSLSRAANSSINIFGDASKSVSASGGLKAQPSLEVLNSPVLLVPPSPAGPSVRSGRRRSFLPLDAPPTLNIPIPKSPFLTATVAVGGSLSPTVSGNGDADSSAPGSTRQSRNLQEVMTASLEAMPATNEVYAKALRSVMAYLRDMQDLGPSELTGVDGPYGSGSPATSEPASRNSPVHERIRRPTLMGGESGDASHTTSTNSAPRTLKSMPSTTSLRGGGGNISINTSDSGESGQEERKYKDDKAKRVHILREIVETERTYVKQLGELVEIYIEGAGQPVNSITGTHGKETVVPLAERKVVFNGLESLYVFHRKNFLPELEKALAPLSLGDDAEGARSSGVAKAVAHVFVSHAAFMRMYSTYINNFDNCLQRLQAWTTAPPANAIPIVTSPASSTAHLVGLGLTMSMANGMGPVLDAPVPSTPSTASITNSQRKRIKQFLKKSKLNPKHSQLNLEGYLLLPVQRIPRYRLLLEQLVTCTPPRIDAHDDTLEKAFEEIASLANNMNEGKREAESRRKLVQWQSRIRGKFPSPLVQPHRRLIMDGRLNLSRVIRKGASFFEVVNSEGQNTVVQVECLMPESTPRTLVGILCNDLLVLCKDPSQGTDPKSPVDLWAVLRMQKLAKPASIVHGHALRIVDQKAILYFDMPSTSDALTWSRAINIHIPDSR
ncbi:hypothetical protein FRC03_012358 [Tulasnella sp. 419]|nr:hypothetical protein FRC03_012358 [Tulasnella sp. 419]